MTDAAPAGAFFSLPYLTSPPEGDLWLPRPVTRECVPYEPQKSAAPAHAGRAAQYVRMSTDHQQYSIDNQCAAIAAFAASKGLEVVRTYADSGKSGVSLQERYGLQQLLDDVTGGRADFAVVLVYDVSRWGRFQDSDEGAYYEYLCRRAGVAVEYCAEPFRNDLSAISSLIKNLKRIMAGEYSRELSAKIFQAKCRMVQRGYRQGGPAGFGLRRMLVDPAGRPRAVLEHGQRKAFECDRVVLVPGPPAEIAKVRWIFRQVAYHGRGPSEIARLLNRQGVRQPSGRAWKPCVLRHVLVNEKYIGNLVFNRRSVKMMRPAVNNPPDQWVRVNGAYRGIVPRRLFARAQEAMARWTTRITDERAIELLRGLYEKHGYLTERLIDSAPGMPCYHFYYDRFGGILRAYALAGYRPRRDLRFIEGHGARLRLAAALREEVEGEFRRRGATVAYHTRSVLLVNGACRVAVLVPRRLPDFDPPRWCVQHHVEPRPHWLLVARVESDGLAVRDYCVVSGGPQSYVFGRPIRQRRAGTQAPEVGPLVEFVLSRAPALQLPWE